MLVLIYSNEFLVSILFLYLYALAQHRCKVKCAKLPSAYIFQLQSSYSIICDRQSQNTLNIIT